MLRYRTHGEVPVIGNDSGASTDGAYSIAVSNGKPRLILMDEPLAGMSKGDRETIGSLILGLRESMGLTFVVVEHDVGMVMRLSDRITVMQQGAVIADGPPDEIRDNEAVRRAYLKGDFAG